MILIIHKNQSVGLWNRVHSVLLKPLRQFLIPWIIAGLAGMASMTVPTPASSAPPKYYSIQDGDWEDFIWSEISSSDPSCNCLPTCNFSRDVIISHQLTASSCASLKIGGGAKVEIKNGGNLTINGPLSLSGGSTIIIGTGDTLHINGKTELTGNSSIVVNGFLVIDGNLVLNGNANICGSGDGIVMGSISGGGWCFTGVLPIELVRFEGWESAGSVSLRWTTASEVSNDYFTIEHSRDGKAFNPIGTIKGAGNSSKTTSYLFEDTSPFPGMNFYRLRQTNFDGVSSVSSIARVNVPYSELQISVSPNLLRAGNPLHVNIQGDLDFFDLKIFDLRGNLQFATAFNSGENKWIAINDHKLKSGQYILLISSGEAYRRTSRLMVQ